MEPPTLSHGAADLQAELQRGDSELSRTRGSGQLASTEQSNVRKEGDKVIKTERVLEKKKIWPKK